MTESDSHTYKVVLRRQHPSPLSSSGTLCLQIFLLSSWKLKTTLPRSEKKNEAGISIVLTSKETYCLIPLVRALLQVPAYVGESNPSQWCV